MSASQPEAVEELMSAIDRTNTEAIRRNYLFYIRLGKSGTEKMLLKALEEVFSYQMCIDFLNCGNSEIEEGAKSIAWENGYEVTTESGEHSGPTWGSGNN
jgi:hypothetical protein